MQAIGFKSTFTFQGPQKRANEIVTASIYFYRELVPNVYNQDDVGMPKSNILGNPASVIVDTPSGHFRDQEFRALNRALIFAKIPPLNPSNIQSAWSRHSSTIDIQI